MSIKNQKYKTRCLMSVCFHSGFKPLMVPDYGAFVMFTEDFCLCALLAAQ